MTAEKALSQTPPQTTEDFVALGHTPMMAQYLATKTAHPDCLLFYRMGDFYELFFEDAEIASAVLDITLTKRGKDKGTEIPMCGVPFHACDPYLARLIRAGHKVAICEQVETPEEAKKRGGAKALVRRDVVRVVTGGTLTEDHLLDARENNYLAAISEANGTCALAWLELSTGRFYVQTLSPEDLSATLARLNPGEALYPRPFEETDAYRDLIRTLGPKGTPQDAAAFHSGNAQKRLETRFGVQALDAFGEFSRAALSACGALIDYLDRTQVGRTPRLDPPAVLRTGAFMEIDAATRRNLELTRTLDGQRKGTLLSTIDRTVTGPGARLLQDWLSAPLQDRAAIDERLDRIAFFLDRPDIRDDIRTALKSMSDMERALSRLSLERGGPRDLGMIRGGLTCAADIQRVLINPKSAGSDIPPAIKTLTDALDISAEIETLRQTFDAALEDDLPALSRDGGFIRASYDPVLEELRRLKSEGRQTILALQGTYQKRTGIDALKISYNNILGYYIEVPAKKADPLLAHKNSEDTDNPFIHRQTMANAVRFTTPELAETEQKLGSAGERALAIEQEIFGRLRTLTLSCAAGLCKIAAAISMMDIAAGLADLAADYDYTRPNLTENRNFSIRRGRHPVVEAALRKQAATFSANDCALNDDQRLWLLTGPNMAGKSTFLRQNALIAILAQSGSYVPAEHAEIGLIDRVFSRVGASDDLASGRSTFMVEMVETAAILNQATDRSLVILDEIGRGTATFDGLSIAWACIEHLHDANRCRTLFATHYHELTALGARLSSLSCNAMEVREWHGDIVFTHNVVPGSADRSYGIHVARLAGLPAPVIERAKAVLDHLQSGERTGTHAVARMADDLPLFAEAQSRPPAQDQSPSVPALKKLQDINPDDLTPKAALDVLYELKAVL